MLYSIDLPWLSFNVNLQTVRTWMKANIDSSAELSADYDLTVWLANQPTADQISAAQTYWNALTTSSPEATSYQSKSQINAAAASAQATNLASATSKLEALGLTQAEIQALIGGANG